MIGSALERGSLIVVYDEKGMSLFSKVKGSGPQDGLLGFTGSTVTVRFGSINLHLRCKWADRVRQVGVTDHIVPVLDAAPGPLMFSSR
jgi:hypothetical protein